MTQMASLHLPQRKTSESGNAVWHLCPSLRQTLDELQSHALRRRRRRHVSLSLRVQSRRGRERGGGADPGGGVGRWAGEAEGVVEAGPAVAAADLPLAVFLVWEESIAVVSPWRRMISIPKNGNMRELFTAF
jgi:hypothetical protein